MVLGRTAGADDFGVRVPAGVADVGPAVVRVSVKPQAAGYQWAAGPARGDHRATTACYQVPALETCRLWRDRIGARMLYRWQRRRRRWRSNVRRRKRGRQWQCRDHGGGRVGQQPGRCVRTVVTSAVGPSAGIGGVGVGLFGGRSSAGGRRSGDRRPRCRERNRDHVQPGDEQSSVGDQTERRQIQAHQQGKVQVPGRAPGPAKELGGPRTAYVTHRRPYVRVTAVAGRFGPLGQTAASPEECSEQLQRRVIWRDTLKTTKWIVSCCS